jgi:nucleoside-diphosphate-sugar epimerase
MHNSALININVAKACVKYEIPKVFYSSSACIYPEFNQLDPDTPNCEESTVYPAQPDSEYGWEKLFSERLYLAYHRNYGLDVKIARFHNIFGPEGTWSGGKEKAPAAMCRKVAQAIDGNYIEVWGDGNQTRSFLYIDECVDAVLDLMKTDFHEPVNIGSEEMISINDLAKMAIDISGKNLKIMNVESTALGVRGRVSDNRLLESVVGWAPKLPLRLGMEVTYNWINAQNYLKEQSERA